MSIVTVIKKDLMVYTRHRRTLLLIFLAPVLIMVLIGSVFSGPSDGLREVRLGVGGSSPLGDRIIDELKKSEMFIIVREDTSDPAVIESGVRQGTYSAGIFIPENTTQTIRLYLDNSRLQIAPVVSSVFLITTEKMSYELTLGFISNLWENLAQMEAELGPLKEGIIKINGSISTLNNDTQHVLGLLDGVNASNLNLSVIQMKTTMDSMRNDLNRTADEIEITRTELLDLNRNVSSINNDSGVLRDELKRVIDSIDTTDAALLEIQNNLQQTYNATCFVPSTAECISLASTIQQVKDTRALLLNRTDRIRSFHTSLENVALTSAELQEKLRQTDLRLQNMQSSIGNYTREISHIEGNITDIEEVIGILEEVKSQSADVSLQMEALTREMVNGTSGLISDIDWTTMVLREVISKSPASVAAPIKLEREAVFKDKSHLDFLMPGIISIVLMFISFLLASITIVQERAKKTLIRTLLTPLSLEEFVVAKTTALVLIALLQGIILIIVALLLYDVIIPVSRWGELFLVILVYAASFIGIGMAVATFAESENTAMLTSLVLSIPMLFLSGVFFPFETMPQLMILLGNALPITIGIRALSSVLIYQEGFAALGGYLTPLLVYGLAGLLLAYVLLRKEVVD